MEPDFSGWATKANLRCSDGRTIKPEAFAHMDGKKVPLVWAHSHDTPDNVLGHAILSARPEGVWADGFFNDSAPAKHADTLVQHRDIDSLSIYANQLVERGKEVFHGIIREVSLVMAGANPGARIEQVRIAHGDGFIDTLEDEAVIFTGEALQHSATPTEPVVEEETPAEEEAVEEEVSSEEETDGDLEHADGEDLTVQDVYESMTEEQKSVVNYMLGVALEAAATENNPAAQHSTIQSDDAESEDNITHQEGNEMSRNLFESNGVKADDAPVLKHSDLESIQEKAQEIGSYRKAFLAHALEHGITDIDMLFPDAKSVTSQPDLVARRTEWVSGVIDGAKHSPFSRIKSLAADLTADEARAKGYVKGNLKKEEVIKLLKRVTIPTTVYKKQKLDRDDIIDITTLDVVAWLKWEMRFMLEEELARAILIGDGREPDDLDKIDEDKLRPIAWDNDMYAHSVNVPSNTTAEGYVEAFMRSRKFYKGTGRPTLYTTDDILTDMLLIKNKIGSYVYPTEEELAAKLRVSSIVVVEVMENEPDLLGIIVNIADYTIGADQGGQISMFDDFDIDYNQQKYLIETRVSGALTKPKSAVVLKRTTGTTVTPQVPAFDAATNTITVPNQTGVAYYDVTDALNEVALADGASVVITKTTDVEARAEAGYSFPHNTDTDWTYAYTV